MSRDSDVPEEVAAESTGALTRNLVNQTPATVRITAHVAT